MENNYSNYDMLDKLIGNNKKAKSWTAFWLIILCLMAFAVLWLAYTISQKQNAATNKKITTGANYTNICN
jgi:type II secretory pathway component PulL